MSRRQQRTFGLPAAWWPVAFGDEVSSVPRAYRLGDRRLALFRDGGGIVRAVEDICPHRRLPLSMGRLTQDGHLQCGYHGWCFDGASGQCVAIPNFDAHEKVSPAIRVPAFNTAEGDLPDDQALTLFDAAVADGFIHVWTGSDAPDAAPVTAPDGAAAGVGKSSRGEMEVRAPYTSVADALLWNPGRALGLGTLLGEGEEVVDPHVDERGGAVTARRERLAVDLPRASTFDPLVGRAVTASVATSADTGFTQILVMAEPRFVVRVVVGLSPTGDYRTMVRWTVQWEGWGARALAVAGRVLQRLRDPVRGRVAALEKVADAVEDAVDPAVDLLRAVRSSPELMTAGASP